MGDYWDWDIINCAAISMFDMSGGTAVTHSSNEAKQFGNKISVGTGISVIEPQSTELAPLMTMSDKIAVLAEKVASDEEKRWADFFSLLERYYEMEPAIAHMHPQHQIDLPTHWAISTREGRMYFVKESLGVFDVMYQESPSITNKLMQIIQINGPVAAASIGLTGVLAIADLITVITGHGFIAAILTMIIPTYLYGVCRTVKKKIIEPNYVPVTDLSNHIVGSPTQSLLSDFHNALNAIENKINRMLAK